MRNSLVDVLTRFCTYAHALISDIHKLYYQCVIKKSNQELLHFLWYKDYNINMPIVEYKIKFKFWARVVKFKFWARSTTLYCLDPTIQDNATNASLVTVLTALKSFFMWTMVYLALPSKMS